MNVSSTITNVDDQMDKIVLSYITAHYDVKEMSLEDFYKKFAETRSELSDIWAKHRLT